MLFYFYCRCLSCPDGYDKLGLSSHVLALKDLRINCVVHTPGILNNTLDYTWTLQQKEDGGYIDKSDLVKTGKYNIYIHLEDSLPLRKY